MLRIPLTTPRARRVWPRGWPDVQVNFNDMIAGGITREAILEAIRLLPQVSISSAYLYAQTQTQLEPHVWGP